MASSLIRTGTIGPEPVTLAAMKNWLRVAQTNTVDDNDIKALIQEARMEAELLSNCALVRQTFVQYHDHFPGWRLGYGASFDGAGVMTGPGLRSGYGDGISLNRHPLEIKIKRPPLVSVQSLTFIGTDGRPYTLNPGQDFIVDTAAQPGRIRPVPFTVWPLTLPGAMNAIAIAFTAGYAPNADADGQTISEPETSTPSLPPSWQPGTQRAQYSFIIDPLGNVEVQMNAGTPTTGAGPSQPTWPAIGQQVTDGGCSWLNCGPIRGFWAPGVQYAGQQSWVVLDYNSNLQLLNVSSLESETIAPYGSLAVGTEPLPWATVIGAFTADNGIANAWRCLGPYNALGGQVAIAPNSPEQQAAYTQDYTLPRQVTRFVKALAWHWYYNREPVASGSVSKVPFHIEAMLGGVTVEDYSPTP